MKPSDDDKKLFMSFVRHISDGDYVLRDELRTALQIHAHLVSLYIPSTQYEGARGKRLREGRDHLRGLAMARSWYEIEQLLKKYAGVRTPRAKRSRPKRR